MERPCVFIYFALVRARKTNTRDVPYVAEVPRAQITFFSLVICPRAVKIFILCTLGSYLLRSLPKRHLTMKLLFTTFGLITTIACQSLPSAALVGPRPNVSVNMPSIAASSKPALSMSGGGGASESEPPVKDYGSEMSALFGNIRVP